ncbi:MAG TPA: hypothetical protein PKD79_00325 [Candidatus Doudnabacteria bacterium]|nr:hypothetical protein [Candidatus Doudnabacteria bacterium]
MSLKENLQVQAAGAALGAQEGVWRISTWFKNLVKWQQIFLVVILILLIPGYFVVRYGVELVMLRQYSQQALVAHTAFSAPDALVHSRVNLITNPSGTITAYATVRNPNLDLSLDNLRYTVNFFNQNNQPVFTTNGSVYLLPDQQRWLVVPRVDSGDNIVSAEIVFEQPAWQRRLTIPDVELRMSEPVIYQQDNPLVTITEGAVINNSPFSLRQVSLVLVMYNTNNQVVAVTTREEFTLQPFERRAYLVQWPGLSRNAVSRIGLEAYTNTLDATNLSAPSAP